VVRKVVKIRPLTIVNNIQITNIQEIIIYMNKYLIYIQYLFYNNQNGVNCTADKHTFYIDILYYYYVTKYCIRSYYSLTTISTEIIKISFVCAYNI